jgi:hypothetical protein
MTIEPDLMVELAKMVDCHSSSRNSLVRSHATACSSLRFVAVGVCAKGSAGQRVGGRTVGASRSYLAHTFLAHTFRGYWLLMVMESVGEMRPTDGGTHR